MIITTAEGVVGEDKYIQTHLFYSHVHSSLSVCMLCSICAELGEKKAQPEEVEYYVDAHGDAFLYILDTYNL